MSAEMPWDAWAAMSSPIAAVGIGERKPVR